MSVRSGIARTAIVKAFAANTSQVAVELQSSVQQTVQLQLVNNMGVLISSVSKKLETGSTTFYLNTPVLSSGIYHLRLIAAGESSLSSFIKN